MLDAALLFLLQQPVEQAVVLETGIEPSDVLEIVQQKEVNIVHLEIFQGSLEHLLSRLERRPAVHVGNLGRDPVG